MFDKPRGNFLKGFSDDQFYGDVLQVILVANCTLCCLSDILLLLQINKVIISPAYSSKCIYTLFLSKQKSSGR